MAKLTNFAAREEMPIRRDLTEEDAEALLWEERVALCDEQQEQEAGID